MKAECYRGTDACLQTFPTGQCHVRPDHRQTLVQEIPLAVPQRPFLFLRALPDSKLPTASRRGRDHERRD